MWWLVRHLALRIASRIRLTLPKVMGRGSKRSYVLGLLTMAEKADEVQLLDVIDAALAERNGPTVNLPMRGKSRQPPGAAEDLAFILNQGGSAYRVNDGRTGLERRVPVTVTAAVRRAVDSSSPSFRLLLIS
jgi:hypothetical protein